MGGIKAEGDDGEDIIPNLWLPVLALSHIRTHVWVLHSFGCGLYHILCYLVFRVEGIQQERRV